MNAIKSFVTFRQILDSVFYHLQSVSFDIAKIGLLHTTRRTFRPVIDIYTSKQQGKKTSSKQGKKTSVRAVQGSALLGHKTKEESVTS